MEHISEYSSSENSPDSHHRLGHHQHAQHGHHGHHHQMMSSRLSPVSPATSNEDRHLPRPPLSAGSTSEILTATQGTQQADEDSTHARSTS